MKKLWTFLRSMRFGMLLLACIAVLCVLGSVITQAESAEYYTQTYGETWGSVLLWIGADRVFSTWYFIALSALFCLNLLLCCVFRALTIPKLKTALLTSVRTKAPVLPLSSKVLTGFGTKMLGDDIWLKNGIGFYGSFLTHVAILLLLVSAACVFAFQSASEYSVKVGASEVFPDGTRLMVNDFETRNIQGETDYLSELTFSFPDGTVKDATVAVNEPFRWADYSLYQASYNMNAALVEFYTDSAPDPLELELGGETFLSLDGVNGIHIITIYGDYSETEDGQLEAFNYSDGQLKNPVYLVETIEKGETKTGLVLPGTVLYAGGVYCRFPRIYPVFTLKYLPRMIMPVMYASFILMILGLYLCFFCIPAAFCVRDGGIAAAAAKNNSEWIEQLKKEIEKC